MSSVAVIDYGMGNLHSVAKALEHVQPGIEVRVTADPELILSADRVLLPGVGAIRDCMGEIRRLEIDKVVQQVIESGKPFLAICVGIQALMRHSEENNGVDCLNFFSRQYPVFWYRPERFQRAINSRFLIWAGIRFYQRTSHPLWQNIEDGSRFYFVHSYYVKSEQSNQVSATCEYNVEFDVALSENNVFAVQFHPEKARNLVYNC